MKYLLVLCLLGLCSCTKQRTKTKTEVDAVYWHENNRYTVAVNENDTVYFIRIPNLINVPVILKTDVPENEKSWYKYDYEYSSWSGATGVGSVEIHIHNLDELKVTDWNHGKFGSGTTKKID